MAELTLWNNLSPAVSDGNSVAIATLAEMTLM